ncbi:MAG: membrane or secreted protein [Cyclobacteriaceae bacterium]
MLNIHRYLVCFLVLSFYVNLSFAQVKKGTYVDKQGVIRWGDSKEEVKGFGVNYSVPFAHSYRSAKRMGVEIKQAMDNDIYHLSRLGFDLYRCHLWDTEISDTLGNLLENEHLDAFDYLMGELRSRGFNYVLTPIGYWGNGWPEPDESTPGFSFKYGKNNSLTNQMAIKAAHNYLKQLLNHVNPYTGLAYKDDPNVIAFEVSNEPHHSGSADSVELFVSNMVNAMKSTGTTTPIFYNVSHGVHFAESYLKGGAEGGTFQWYPTGLVYNRELSGNLLPNVDNYEIPFDSIMRSNSAAKIVYEFDAADVGRSYIYPAMARSLRTAGIQVATQFAYDATFLAHVNTDYNTHYMNLSYTPQKAISLMIAGEVFHRIDRYDTFGSYPDNTNFGDFMIDYESDLACYIGEEQYLYTNNTKQLPKDERKLRRIVGYGDSPLIKYDGRGAYFLDKLEDGIWRLEVQPDAIWVQNPFGKNSPDKQVAAIKWNENQMRFNLKELGQEFKVRALNGGNYFETQVVNGTFSIKPGAYLISSDKVKTKLNANTPFGFYRLGDYFAPEENVSQNWLIHESKQRLNRGEDAMFTIEYISQHQPKSITMVIQSPRVWEEIPLEQVDQYTYQGVLTKDNLNKEGFLYYDFVVETATDEFWTYPTNRTGHPYDWDFYDRKRYVAEILNIEKPLSLFDAHKDSERLVRKWLKSINLLPSGHPSSSELHISVANLNEKDWENLNAKPLNDFSFKHFIDADILENQSLLTSKKVLGIKAHSLHNKKCKFQVALVTKEGVSYGNVVTLESQTKELRIDLSQLIRVETVTLPRPYPSFLPYCFDPGDTSDFDNTDIESIQFSIGPGIPSDQMDETHGVALESVWLE